MMWSFWGSKSVIWTVLLSFQMSWGAVGQWGCVLSLLFYFGEQLPPLLSSTFVIFFCDRSCSTSVKCNYHFCFLLLSLLLFYFGELLLLLLLSTFVIYFFIALVLLRSPRKPGRQSFAGSSSPLMCFYCMPLSYAQLLDLTYQIFFPVACMYSGAHR